MEFFSLQKTFCTVLHSRFFLTFAIGLQVLKKNFKAFAITNRKNLFLRIVDRTSTSRRRIMVLISKWWQLSNLNIVARLNASAEWGKDLIWIVFVFEIPPLPRRYFSREHTKAFSPVPLVSAESQTERIIINSEVFGDEFCGRAFAFLSFAWLCPRNIVSCESRRTWRCSRITNPINSARSWRIIGLNQVCCPKRPRFLLNAFDGKYFSIARRTKIQI